MKIKTIRRTRSGQYYFSFLTDEEKLVLKSEIYNSKDACENGKRSVRRNAPIDNRYDRLRSSDQKYYFNLKAANGETIGTSPVFDTAEKREEAIQLLKGLKPDDSARSAAPPENLPEEKSTGAESQKSPAQDLLDPDMARQLDDYQELDFYRQHASGQKGFYPFRAAGEGDFYFCFNDNDGKLILISQGYTTSSGRDNGIRSVQKNAGIAKRYSRQINAEGKAYFTLRAGNNQEIARSFMFDSQGEMEVGISQLMSLGSSKSTKSANARIYKDYKPLSFYESHIAREDYGFDSFAADDKYFFTLNYAGAPILLSEDYTSEAGRDKGIRSVKKNIKLEKRYEPMVHPNGKYYFNLLAGNKQEIATSVWFDSEKDREKAIHWLLSTGGTRKRKRVKREKKKAVERRYLQQGQSYPCSEIRYDTFQSGGNQKYYFVFKTKEDKAILINGNVRGHNSEEELSQTIRELLKHAPHKENYELKTTKNGKTYFYVNNKEGQHLGRSSLFYDSKEQMNEAIALLSCGQIPMAPTAVGLPKIDAYLASEAYSGEDGFHRFQEASNGEYYFAFNQDKKTFLRSKGYQSAVARDNGIDSVIKNAPLDDRWKTTEEEGKHYFVLRAGHDQEIARSCPYESKSDLQTDLNWVRGDRSIIGKGASQVGGVWRSAFALMEHEKEAAQNKKIAEQKVAKEAEAEAKRKVEASKEVESAEDQPVPLARTTPVVEDREDEYLGCRHYRNHSLTDEQNRVALFTHDNGKYYFAVYDEEGEVRLRSEGFNDPEKRKAELSSVLKNLEKKEMYQTIERGMVQIKVLLDATGNEIARSCPEKNPIVVPVPEAAGSVVAAAAAEPVLEEERSYEPSSYEAESSGGGIKWWWFLPLLLIPIFFFGRGCEGCGNRVLTTPVPEEQNDATSSATESNLAPGGVAGAAVACNCNASRYPVFDLNDRPQARPLNGLQVNPQFEAIESLSPAAFYDQLRRLYQQNEADRTYLDEIFREMGYTSGFSGATPALFTELIIPAGTAGNLGYTPDHETLYASLGTEQAAFRIRAANGCDLNFIKSLGNHFFYCPN